MNAKTNLMNRMLENTRPLVPELDLLKAGTGRASNGAVDLRGSFNSPQNRGTVWSPSSAVWMAAWRPQGIPELDSPLAD